MKFNSGFARTGLAAIMLSGLVWTLPAAANETARFFENEAGATTVASATVDDRLSDLESRISRAVATGTLPPAAAADLRAELSGISQLEAQFKLDGTLSAAETEKLLQRLDLLSARIQMTPVTSSVPPAHLHARRAELARRIYGGLASRRLTASSAADLIAQLRTANSHSLDRLNAQLDQMIGEGGSVADIIDSRQEELRARVAAGLASAQLTDKQASRIRRQLRAVAMRERYFKASRGGLDTSERDRITRSLDRLSDRLDRKISNRQFAYRNRSNHYE